MVIRNITVIGGLSFHLFPLARFFFSIVANVTEQNYSGSQLKGPFSLSPLIRGLLIPWQWLALNRP